MLMLIVLALLAALGVAATIVAVARDGYGRIRTDRSRQPGRPGRPDRPDCG
jgi:hypothetical protein